MASYVHYILLHAYDALDHISNIKQQVFLRHYSDHTHCFDTANFQNHYQPKIVFSVKFLNQIRTQGSKVCVDISLFSYCN